MALDRAPLCKQGQLISGHAGDRLACGDVAVLLTGEMDATVGVRQRAFGVCQGDGVGAFHEQQRRWEHIVLLEMAATVPLGRGEPITRPRTRLAATTRVRAVSTGPTPPQAGRSRRARAQLRSRLRGGLPKPE